MTEIEQQLSNSIVVRFVDECLADLGTQSLFDGDRIRDMLLDIRRLLTTLAEPEAV